MSLLYSNMCRNEVNYFCTHWIPFSQIYYPQSPNMLPDWNRSKEATRMENNITESREEQKGSSGPHMLLLSPLNSCSSHDGFPLAGLPTRHSLTWCHPLCRGWPDLSLGGSLSSLFHNIYHDSLVGEDHAYPSHPQLQHGRKGGRERRRKEGSGGRRRGKERKRK